MAGEVRSQVRRPLNLFFYIYMCPFSGFWEISMLRSSLGPCREGFTWFLVVMRRIPAGRRLKQLIPCSPSKAPSPLSWVGMRSLRQFALGLKIDHT